LSLRRTLQLQQQRLQHLLRLKTAPDDLDTEVLRALSEPGLAPRQGVEALVQYFWATHRYALDEHGTLADYPGWPSMYGARNDAIEGSARLAPLWAACVGAGFGSAARQHAMADQLRALFLHATDPVHPGFWGAITDRSTLICEAHDLALALWLSRAQVFEGFAMAEQDRVLNWLSSALGRRTADNNWHLFVALIDAVVCALRPGRPFSSQDRLGRIWEFARQDGCFVDGPGGHVDLYNAWGFHYSLAFLAQLAPGHAGVRGSDALAAFCAWYQWLFTAEGLPLFGRSLCYRNAAPAPLVQCAAAVPGVVSADTAAAALLSNWRYFAQRGGLRAGRPTQGVFGEDLRWLDIYSGPASSLWGTRSLVAWVQAFGRIGPAEVSDLHRLRLPADSGHFDRFVPGLGARVIAAQGVAEVHFEASDHAIDPVRHPSWRDRLKQLRYATASRPDNNRLKAGVRRFTSRLELYT
jgi:hypothetical protein